MSDPVTPPGHFGWNELYTPDAEAARAFYSGVFGWSVDEMEMGEGATYHMFKQGDAMVGGMLELNDQMPGAQPGWMGYINVADLEETMGKVTECGGTVVMGPHQVGEMGKMAVILDPGGAVFSLWQSLGKPECPES